MGSRWSYYMVVRVPAHRSTQRIHKLYLITWPRLYLCALSFPPLLLPNLLKIALYQELTLDHQTSLSSPTNTGPWFVSSTHVDPWVLHTDIWDHQVACAEYLDSLHTNRTAVYAWKTERQRFRRMGKNLYRAAKKAKCAQVQYMFMLGRGEWGVYYSKGQSTLKSPARKPN